MLKAHIHLQSLYSIIKTLQKALKMCKHSICKHSVNPV